MSKLNLTQETERRIARQVIKDLLTAGFHIKVDNGEYTVNPKQNTNSILKQMFQTDEEHLVAEKEGCKGWVFFVYGNDGWDVVSDYTCNLEEYLKNVNELADRLGE